MSSLWLFDAPAQARRRGNEGGVAEGDLVIYRLAVPRGGRGWGVGRVIALQVNYSRS